MDKYQQLETLYQVRSFIEFQQTLEWSESTQKEWNDKLDANQAEIDSLLNSL